MIMNGAGIFGIIRVRNDLKMSTGVRQLSEKIFAERITAGGIEALWNRDLFGASRGVSRMRPARVAR